jgi:hypothetical protein
MELKDFIGQVVIGVETKKRYVLRQITAPNIVVSTVEKDARGKCASYCWATINGDPISNGILIFEDDSLTEQFIAAYNAYSNTQAAYYEEIGYWMRKD